MFERKGDESVMILQAERLRLQYKNYRISDYMDFSVEKPEIISLIGAADSEKSTLLQILGRVLKPLTGAVLLETQDIRILKPWEAAKKIAFLTQSPKVSEDMTVYDWMFYGQLKYRKLLFRENPADVAVVEEVLAFVNIENLAMLRLSKLTAGQRQCVSIAMALTHKPEVLLIEEPILGLDIYEQLEVMTLLKRLKNQLGLTILITMQDLNQAARFSDRLLALKQGNIIADGNVKEVFTLEILRQLYDIDDKTMKLPHDAMNQCLYLPADIGQPA